MVIYRYYDSSYKNICNISPIIQNTYRKNIGWFENIMDFFRQLITLWNEYETLKYNKTYMNENIWIISH